MSTQTVEKTEVLDNSDAHYQTVSNIAAHLGKERESKLKTELGDQYGQKRQDSDLEYKSQLESNLARSAFNLTWELDKKYYKPEGLGDYKSLKTFKHLAGIVQSPSAESKSTLQEHLDPYALTSLVIANRMVKTGVSIEELDMAAIGEKVEEQRDSDKPLNKNKTIRIGLEAELLIPDKYNTLTDIRNYPTAFQNLVEQYKGEENIPDAFQKVIDYNKLEHYVDATESLNHLGFKVFNQALREIILEDGTDIENIRAIQHLNELGIIRPDQDVNFHVNISGIENPEKYIADLMLIHIVCSSLGYFGEHNLIDGMPEGADKPIIRSVEGKNIPIGLPILIRDTNVVEFRHIAPHWDNNERFSIGLLTFSKLCEGLAAYSRVFEQGSTDPKDIELANEWDFFKEKLFTQLDTQLTDPTTTNAISPNIHKSLETFQKYTEIAKITAIHRSTEEQDRKTELSEEVLLKRQKDFLKIYYDTDADNFSNGDIYRLFGNVTAEYRNSEWFWDLNNLVLKNTHGHNPVLKDQMQQVVLRTIDRIKEIAEIKV